MISHTLRKKCPYSELFWSAFSGIQTEYVEIQSISQYSVQIWENADQNNSEYGHFPCNVDGVIKYHLVRGISAASLNFSPSLEHTPTPTGCLRDKQCAGPTPLKKSYNNHLKLKLKVYFFLGIVFSRKFPSIQEMVNCCISQDSFKRNHSSSLPKP